VPGEISVVGYDDSRLARLAHVDLTTIAQDTTAMTRLAVSRAIARVEGKPVDRREVVVPPRLVVRGTTGPAAWSGMESWLLAGHGPHDVA